MCLPAHNIFGFSSVDRADNRVFSNIAWIFGAVAMSCQCWRHIVNVARQHGLNYVSGHGLLACLVRRLLSQAHLQWKLQRRVQLAGQISNIMDSTLSRWRVAMRQTRYIGWRFTKSPLGNRGLVSPFQPGEQFQMSDIQRAQVGPRYSECSAYGGIVFLAGQISSTATRDIKGQTSEILSNIDRLLAEVGSNKSRVLMVQIFLSDMADYAAMNEVWDAWVVPGSTPSRATVQAQLARPEWKVEIVVTAAGTQHAGIS